MNVWIVYWTMLCYITTFCFLLLLPIKLMTRQLINLQPDDLQLTPFEYQELFGLLDHAKQLRPCNRSMSEYIGYSWNILYMISLDRKELVQYILCNFPTGRRLQCLASFTKLESLNDVPLRSLLIFMKNT